MALPRERALPAVLLALTAVTGLVDAVSFLALGHIFTANMTGNVVFLGFALAGVPGLSLTRSGLALAVFAVGAVIGGRMALRLGGAARRFWTSLAFGAESLLLLAAAGAAATGGDLSERPRHLYPVIGLTALAMGIRNAVVRKLGEHDLTTTVLTLTIAGLAADSPLAGGTNPGLARRISSVVLLFAGAATGAWLLHLSVAAPLTAGGLVAGICAIAVYSRTAPPEAPRPH
jgi:uncharacterized membrane protein YoaK (UPF0700 family)